MKRLMHTLRPLILSWLLLAATAVSGQTYPTINPTLSVLNSEEGDTDPSSYSGSAPIEVQFYANAENADGWTAHYEWRFYTETNTEEPYLVRYEEDTSYTFLTAGAHYIRLYATFTQGSDVVEYTDDYWQDATPLIVSVSESRLEFPNAFSPNGDGINDIYKAKEGYQSIVEFHAYIYNRWGQLIYEWTDPAGGWDGTHKGKEVKQGVYFCMVKARGADGRVFNIKRDVNLLRGYTESTGASTTE